ncbi:MAG: 30S ribosomal protein S12 methylthiotransferase RimO [Firmicutes bacterium]|nr:30S ribosomal protein S12 methylthiotransferase RimO [Bacillota bacterium]
MKKGKICLISLGCDKNLSDSQVMISLLEEAGFDTSADEYECDIMLINTCCFIKDSLEESIENILEAAQLKAEDPNKKIIVAGCIAQRYKDEVFKEIPEVDAIVGTTGFTDIVSVCEKVLSGEKAEALPDINLPVDEDIAEKKVISAPNHYGYLKISEGCDKHCTYCVIPKIRGKQRSRTIESLVREASRMADAGVKELILVAQDLAAYGSDIYGEKSLHRLLPELEKVEAIEWIRLMYCYPENITDELIDVIAKSEKICRYIDMPVQHGDDRILKLMGRKTTSAEIKEKVNKLREKIPDIAIRTSIIVGFPSEGEEEFENLFNFVREIEFDRLGVFTYSREEGTPAYDMEGQIDEDVKIRRREIIMEEQMYISREKCESQIGKEIPVIIDGKIPEDGVYCGRGEKDAPDIDGMVFVRSAHELESGEIVIVKITEAKDYDIAGDQVM